MRALVRFVFGTTFALLIALLVASALVADWIEELRSRPLPDMAP